VVKFAISDSNTIIDKNGNDATWPNGAMREDAVPYWQTKDWADPANAGTNYIYNQDRKIYTYLGFTNDLTASSNSFSVDNSYLTAAVLGNPTHTPAEIIKFVRGADMFDENEDGNIDENRSTIVGDVLHSEPLVLKYNFSNNTSTTMVFFGSNDGMLHAVLDIDSAGTNRGEEAWAFIPPDQLSRLKYLAEGLSHQYFVDSSPKAYFYDADKDGLVDTGAGAEDKVILVCGERKGGTSYFALDVTNPVAPQFLWRIDRSNTESGIIELDPGSVWINNGGSFQDGDPMRIYMGSFTWGPEITARVEGGMIDYFLPYESGIAPFQIGQYVGNLTSEVHLDWYNSAPEDLYSRFTPTPFIWGRIVSITNSDPDELIPELGESWSEPQFGLVKTFEGDTDGIPVFFIGGGYSADNSAGKAIMAINVITGAVEKMFTGLSGMDYSFASSVAVIDADNNGFVDKVYVGDLGGQMWRIGKFTDASDNPMEFPNCDENINNWTAQLLFVSDPMYQRSFYYPPSLTLEHGYDLVFMGTGDREDPCNPATSDRFYCIKDAHEAVTLSETDLVDVTDPMAAVPDLDNETSDVDLNYSVDKGWYIQLATGEKVLAENTIFYKTVYLTTFVPNGDPCYPGGTGKLYGLEYKTGAAVLDFNNDGNLERSVEIGGGIPSKVVTVITDSGIKLFISVGSTIPHPEADDFDAGVVTIDPLLPKRNFYYLWWRELIDF
jgi:type IV pilus assembly protein PilY1